MTAAFDGNGAFISPAVGATGARYTVVSNGGTITGWNIVCIGTSPTITFDVLYQSSGTGLPSSSIIGVTGTYPALATGNVISSTTLTGWTTTLSAGGTLGFKITAASNVLQAKIALIYQ
jgi:hypothetical protein